MSPLADALAYAGRGWLVFPCKPWPDKRPLTTHGFKEASCDPKQVREWWTRWPKAMPGIPTGAAIGLSVLDIDPKHNGYQTFTDEFGFAVWPETPVDHNPRSGGAHLWFRDPEGRIRNTSGKRGCGIGAGLDWRGTGGYVCPYIWDPHFNFDTVAPLTIPSELLPREPERPPVAPPSRHIRLSRYGEKALDNAVERISGASGGEQEITLNGEAYSIGRLVAGGVMPAGVALDTLLWAASKIASTDPRRPWRAHELETKVRRSFTDGMRQPRGMPE